MVKGGEMDAVLTLSPGLYSVLLIALSVWLVPRQPAPPKWEPFCSVSAVRHDSPFGNSAANQNENDCREQTQTPTVKAGRECEAELSDLNVVQKCAPLQGSPFGRAGTVR